MTDRAKASTAAAALAAALLTIAAPGAARADIWKFVDRDGVVHLSDRPMGPGSVRVVRGKKRVEGTSIGHRPLRYSPDNEQRYSALVERVARELRLDEALVRAVVRVESAYDPHAVSRKGAIGLMQLMPETARRYGARDPRNPTQNVYAGVTYLRDLIRLFDDVVLALAAYNAGENAVMRHGRRIPPYPETRDYVRKVLTFYRRYRTSS